MKLVIKDDSVSLEEKIKNYIKDNFNIINDMAKEMPIYLVGGSIRSLILSLEPKDLDFIVLGCEYNDKLLELINKFNMNYSYNKFGGYKIKYNNIVVDIWTNNDLFSSVEYNGDGIFYYVNDGVIVSLTFDDFIKNGVRKVNTLNNIKTTRIDKIKEFHKKYIELLGVKDENK